MIYLLSPSRVVSTMHSTTSTQYKPMMKRKKKRRIMISWARRKRRISKAMKLNLFTTGGFFLRLEMWLKEDRRYFQEVLPQLVLTLPEECPQTILRLLTLRIPTMQLKEEGFPSVLSLRHKAFQTVLSKEAALCSRDWTYNLYLNYLKSKVSVKVASRQTMIRISRI